MTRLLHCSFILLICSILTACSPDGIDSNGKSVRFSQYHGKWLVVNYWSWWCKSCYQEIDELNTLTHNYGDDVAVLGVNPDGMARLAMAEFATRKHIDYVLLANNPGDRLGVGEVDHMPATFVFSPQRQLVAKLYGLQTADQLAEFMHLKPHQKAS